MRLVIADTGPIRYLVQIGEIDLLPKLFGSVSIPTAVANELRHPSAPSLVRMWINQPPEWMEIQNPPHTNDPGLAGLDPGEHAAIALAISQRAPLILIDERKGTSVAIRKGLDTMGTLGILDLAAKNGLVDLHDVIERLKQTNFRYSKDLVERLLKTR